MGFIKGLLIGSLVGTTYTLLTTNKTGAQRRDMLHEAKEDILASQQQFKASQAAVVQKTQHLEQLVSTDTAQKINDINQQITRFSQEVAPQLDRINQLTDKLTSQTMTTDSENDV